MSNKVKKESMVSWSKRTGRKIRVRFEHIREFYRRRSMAEYVALLRKRADVLGSALVDLKFTTRPPILRRTKFAIKVSASYVAVGSCESSVERVLAMQDREGFRSKEVATWVWEPEKIQETKIHDQE
jgi:hypothetical protein